MENKIQTLATYFEEQCLLHEKEEVDIDTFIDIADSAIQYAKENEALLKRNAELEKALNHAVGIAEAERAGTWDDLLQYRELLIKDRG